MSKYRKTLYFPGGGRKELYGKTKEELEAKIFEAKMQLRAGVKLDENPQFGKYAIMWYEAYKNFQQNQADEFGLKNVPYLYRVSIKKYRKTRCFAENSKI